MQFNYTLDRKGDKWVVQPKADVGGHTGALPGGDKAPGELPPNHPAIPASPKQ